MQVRPRNYSVLGIRQCLKKPVPFQPYPKRQLAGCASYTFRLFHNHTKAQCNCITVDIFPSSLQCSVGLVIRCFKAASSLSQDNGIGAIIITRMILKRRLWKDVTSVMFFADITDFAKHPSHLKSPKPGIPLWPAH
jgi:branched-subunit amino acid transport protein AzlD